jgi:hypothetical protein
VLSRDGELIEAVLDSDAPSDDGVLKADKQAKTKPKKKMARPRPLASKKPNIDSRTVRVVEPLSAVERMPPKVWQLSYRRVLPTNCFIAFTTPGFDVGTQARWYEEGIRISASRKLCTSSKNNLTQIVTDCRM